MIRKFTLKGLSIAFGVFIFTNSLSATTECENKTLMQSEIKHVVVLMMENRSFDNILAWLYSHDEVPSFYIPENTSREYHGLSEDTLEAYTNVLKNPAGDVVFTCHPLKGIPSITQSNFLASPRYNPHEAFPNVINQIYGFERSSEPNMSGFLQDYATLWDEDDWLKSKQDICAVMETYTENELPVMYGLARHYALSDLWFSSVPTQTNPNRAFTFCGTSQGEVVNGILAKNNFTADTVWNRLAEESPETTWKIFWQVDMIPGVYLGPYSGPNTFERFHQIPYCHDHFQTIDLFHQQARSGQLPDISFIEPQWTLSVNLRPKDQDEIKHIPFKAYHFLNSEDFWAGLHGNDFHPPGDVRGGENHLANIYTSLCSNPSAWNETLLIVTFDEHGGLFDHVPPPIAIPPDGFCQNGFKFDRYGVRVPTLFISPKINKQTLIRSDTPDVPFDHTSIIATILKWKGVDKSRWNMGRRVDAAPTFESVVTLSIPRTDKDITPEDVSLAEREQEKVIHMKEKFYLRSKEGKYLVKNRILSNQYATVGDSSRKIALEFLGEEGEITHGSFVLIKSCDPALGQANILENVFLASSCRYQNNKHSSGQWWTVKSMNHPFLASKIYDGDKIYLETHVHMNPLQFVPARLTHAEGAFDFFLITEEISSEGSKDNYWIIEKAKTF